LDARSFASFGVHGINNNVVHGAKDAVNPEHVGSKAAAHYVFDEGSAILDSK